MTIEQWNAWDEDSRFYKKFRNSSALETIAHRTSMKTDGVLIDDYKILVSQKIGAVYQTKLSTVDDPTISFLDFLREDHAEAMGIYLDSMFLGQIAPTDLERFDHNREQSLGLVARGGVYGYKSPHTQPSLYHETKNRFFVDTENHDVKGLAEQLSKYAVNSQRAVGLYEPRHGVIAHPAFRKILFPDGYEGKPLFQGLPVKWAIGSKAVEEATSDKNAKGNPLFFVGDVNSLKLGIRSGPEDLEFRYDDAWAEEFRNNEINSFLGASPEDVEAKIEKEHGTHLLKIRARRGFTYHGSPFQCIVLCD